MNISLSPRFGNLNKLLQGQKAREEAEREKQRAYQESLKPRIDLNAIATQAQKIVAAGVLNDIAIPATPGAEAITFADLLVGTQQLIEQNLNGKDYVRDWDFIAKTGIQDPGMKMGKLLTSQYYNDYLGLIEHFNCSPGDNRPVWAFRLTPLGKAVYALLPKS